MFRRALGSSLRVLLFVDQQIIIDDELPSHDQIVPASILPYGGPVESDDLTALGGLDANLGSQRPCLRSRSHVAHAAEKKDQPHSTQYRML